MRDALLWLFTINLGIAFGAGVYEARVVLPLWGSAPPASLQSPDSGHRFWAFVTTVPLTLLVLGNLVTVWGVEGPERAWWVAGVLIALAERAATFGFFIPTMLRLQRATSSTESAVRATFSRWVRLNWLRNVATLLAWLAMLKVVSLR